MGMNEATAAVILFETFGKQDGPRDAKAGGGGEKFRMSKRQRVRGTVVDSCFGETRGNLVSNTVMLPFIQKLLALENPFAHFAYFAVRYPPPVFLSQPLKACKFSYRDKNEAPAFLQRLRECAFAAFCYLTTNTGTLE